MPQPKEQLNRRRSDGDGNDARRAAYRLIAEHAYRLYVEGGCDRSRVTEYWRLAEEAWLKSANH
jgi:DUF2934 family protein